MELYDPMIRRITELLAWEDRSGKTAGRTDEFRSPSEGRRQCRFLFKPDKAWPENEEYECIFQKDTGVLLGGSGAAGCSILCVTTNPDLVKNDETILIGPDLRDLKKQPGAGKQSAPFVRITMLLAEEIEEKKLYRTLQEMDFVKYNIYPKGYMVRASGQSSAEQVRVSKRALNAGISFEQIGNMYLKAYKANPKVLRVQEIFLTAPVASLAELRELSVKAEKIRKSLSVIMKGIDTDCKSCSIREVCNEIEGLREAHFGYQKNTGKNREDT